MNDPTSPRNEPRGQLPGSPYDLDVEALQDEAQQEVIDHEELAAFYAQLQQIPWQLGKEAMSEAPTLSDIRPTSVYTLAQLYDFMRDVQAQTVAGIIHDDSQPLEEPESEVMASHTSPLNEDSTTSEEDSINEDATESNKRGCLWTIAPLIAPTAALIISLLLVDTKEEETPTTAPPAPQVQYDQYCNKADTLIEATGERKPSISSEQLGLLEEKIWEAQTAEEIEQILNDVMGQWRGEVHLNRVPEEQSGWKLTDDPSSLTDEVTKVSAMRFLEAVAEVPESLIRPSRSYLTTGFVLGESPNPGYYFYHGPKGKPTFIIGTGKSEKTKDIATSLFAWDIVFMTCQTTEGHRDKEFTSLNQGMAYGDIGTHPNSGVFLSDNIPGRLEDDKHQIVEKLLMDPAWFEKNFRGHHIETKKDLLLQELGSVNPEGAAQLASSPQEAGQN